MPQTTQCNWCGSILNLPPGIKPGKKFKCPRCGSKFSITEKDASSASTAPGMDDATAASAFDLKKARLQPEDLPPKLGGGDLREAFDLPLTLGSARDMERNDAGRGSQAADAAALFDDRPARRRQTAAEARSQSRRCVTCGTGVPRGMSICSVCGTDQETGLRVGLDDDLAPQAPQAPPGAPAHVSITGMLVIAGSMILMVLAIISAAKTETSIELLSWLALGMVSGFGIYASVQFIRGKSVRLLLVALHTRRDRRRDDLDRTTAVAAVHAGAGKYREPDRCRGERRRRGRRNPAVRGPDRPEANHDRDRPDPRLHNGLALPHFTDGQKVHPIARRPRRPCLMACLSESVCGAKGDNGLAAAATQLDGLFPGER